MIGAVDFRRLVLFSVEELPSESPFRLDFERARPVYNCIMSLSEVSIGWLIPGTVYFREFFSPEANSRNEQYLYYTALILL